jgi:hypothetical protein
MCVKAMGHNLVLKEKPAMSLNVCERSRQGRSIGNNPRYARCCRAIPLYQQENRDGYCDSTYDLVMMSLINDVCFFSGFSAERG